MRSLQAADTALLRLMRTVGHSPHSERAWRDFSALGKSGLVWMAIGLVGGYIDPARGDRWRRASAGVAVTYALNTAIKVVVRRRRPQLPGLPPLTGTPTQLSFPSAHASTSFAGARAYSALAPGAPFYAFASALAFSRPYLGVHYPSDVVAGALLGAAIGSAAR